MNKLPFAAIDEVADAWLAWMLPMAWQVTVLIVIVALLSWTLRSRSARLRYALWLLVPIRLVLPPTLALVTGWGWWILPTNETASFKIRWGEPATSHEVNAKSATEDGVERRGSRPP